MALQKTKRDPKTSPPRVNLSYGCIASLVSSRHVWLPSRVLILGSLAPGVIKTHKLYLNQPPVILAPTLPPQRASRVTVGPRALRDLLDHFGRRADAQLQWMFSEDEVRVRSLERDAENQGIHRPLPRGTLTNERNMRWDGR